MQNSIEIGDLFGTVYELFQWLKVKTARKYSNAIKGTREIRCFGFAREFSIVDVTMLIVTQLKLDENALGPPRPDRGRKGFGLIKLRPLALPLADQFSNCSTLHGGAQWVVETSFRSITKALFMLTSAGDLVVKS